MQKIIDLSKFEKLRLTVSKYRLLYLLFFFSLTPATIALSLLAFNTVHREELAAQEQLQASLPLLNNEFTPVQTPNYGTKIYASLPLTTGQVKGVATSADARFEILRQYLAKYKSPLEPHAQFLVETSEKYDVDFRLLVAIAQQESNLCKKIPDGSFNCWGWGIHSRGTLGFQSYEEAIETVAKGLKEEYINKGFVTPEEIMSKYTPSSPGSWAKGVNQFLAEME